MLSKSCPQRQRNNGRSFGDLSFEKITAAKFLSYVSNSWLASDCLFVPSAGFVKSQEGENEDGNEGELVVKFVDTLPKVNGRYIVTPLLEKSSAHIFDK